MDELDLLLDSTPYYSLLPSTIQGISCIGNTLMRAANCCSGSWFASECGAELGFGGVV